MPKRILEGVVVSDKNDKTIVVKELVTPAKEEKVVEPARFETVKQSIVIEPEKITWVRVLCETNVNEQVIRDVQRALIKKGHRDLKPSGKLDEPTRKAIEAYEAKHQLAKVGLSYDLLGHLGVELANSQK